MYITILTSINQMLQSDRDLLRYEKKNRTIISCGCETINYVGSNMSQLLRTKS